MSADAKSIHWFRCNFEGGEDGVPIAYCEGLHDRSAACQFQRLTIPDVEFLASCQNAVQTAATLHSSLEKIVAASEMPAFDKARIGEALEKLGKALAVE